MIAPLRRAQAALTHTFERAAVEAVAGAWLAGPIEDPFCNREQLARLLPGGLTLAAGTLQGLAGPEANQRMIGADLTDQLDGRQDFHGGQLGDRAMTEQGY